MNRSVKSLVRPVGFSVILLGLALCSRVDSNEAEKSGKVKELQQKRLAVLEQIHDLTKKGFMDGLVSHDQLHTAKADLLSARLDYAETKKDRIKICDEAVKDATAWQKTVQAGAAAKVLSRYDELKAESDLLEAQITRENADRDDE